MKPTLTRRQFTFGASATLSMIGISSGCSGGSGDGDGDDMPVDAGQDERDPTVPGPEPESRWEPDGDLDVGVFPLGIQTGDATDQAIVMSVQTSAEQVEVALAEGTDTGYEEVVRTDAETVSGGFLQMDLANLKPDTTYNVVCYVAGESTRSAVSRFRTALHPDASRIVRMGATSCLGGNRPWPSLSQIAKENLDFFAFLGDTIYADAYSDAAVSGLWQSELSETGLQDITAGTSMVATWDDHEVDNNWSWSTNGMESRFATCLADFQRYMPHRSGRSESGIWRKLSWGKTLDVFVLDCRSERKDGNYISVEQMDWLKTGLSESTAHFKVILNSVPIADFSAYFGSIGADDRWQGFPEQRSEILGHISENEIPRVLWLAGDLHVGGVGKVDEAPNAGAEMWEVLAGPGGSSINFAAGFISPDERLPIVMDEHNSTMLAFDPDENTITVSFMTDSGEITKQRVIEYDAS